MTIEREMRFFGFAKSENAAAVWISREKDAGTEGRRYNGFESHLARVDIAEGKRWCRAEGCAQTDVGLFD